MLSWRNTQKQKKGFHFQALFWFYCIKSYLVHIALLWRVQLLLLTSEWNKLTVYEALFQLKFILPASNESVPRREAMRIFRRLFYALGSFSKGSVITLDSFSECVATKQQALLNCWKCGGWNRTQDLHFHHCSFDCYTWERGIASKTSFNSSFLKGEWV